MYQIEQYFLRRDNKGEISRIGSKSTTFLVS